jgi:protocatechuate 3,4-dioxygenase beta subunit
LTEIMIRPAHVVSCLGLLVAQVVAQAGNPQRETTSVIIQGRVVDAVGGEAVADAQVTLAPQVQELGPGVQRPVRSRVPNPSVLTGANGQFVLENLAPGRYVLQARKSGYTGGFYGQYHPAGGYQVFDLHEGEVAANITLRLWRQSVITGTVRSPSGSPVGATVVQAFLLSPTSGGVELQASLYPSRTDDRGEYRLTNLDPGRYLVCAVPPDNSSPRNAGLTTQIGLPARLAECRAFFPGAMLPTQATTVSISLPGQTVPGVDISVPDSISGQVISGRIEGFPSSCPDAKIRVVLAESSSDLPEGLEMAVAPVASGGSFRFPVLPKGTYFIRGICVPQPDSSLPGLIIKQTASGIRPRPDTRTAVARLPKERLMWFSERVEVGDQPTRPLVLQMQEGAVVSGRVLLDSEMQSSMTSDDLIAIPVFARASRNGWNLEGTQLGRVEADGRFISPALPPGKYLVLPMEHGDWYTETETLGGRDVKNEGINLANRDIQDVMVTLTRRRAHLEGVVRDGAGKPRSDAVIYFFPAERRNWEFGEIRELRPNRAGEYSTPLYAGTWVFAAAVGNPPVSWLDWTFLQSLEPRGKKVTLAKGQRMTADLTVQMIR